MHLVLQNRQTGILHFEQGHQTDLQMAGQTRQCFPAWMGHQTPQLSLLHQMELLIRTQRLVQMTQSRQIQLMQVPQIRL